MIKISKFENVYGIKKLNNCSLIDGNTIIYAPNGVMKTSFADGLLDIQQGKKPYDLFIDPPVMSKFEIENNGTIINDQCSDITLDVLVLRTGEELNDVFSNPNIGSLVMSNSLKVKYKNTIDDYEKVLTEFKELLSKNIFERKKIDEKDLIILEEITSTNNFPDLIEAIPCLDSYDDEYYKKVKYIDIFNDKTKDAIESEEFIEKCNIYNKYIDEKLDEKVFNSGFDFNGLVKIKKSLDDSKYFLAGNKVHLVGQEEMNSEQLSLYIQNTIQSVYGDETTRSLFEEAKKVLTKNTQCKSLLELINKDKRCLKELSNQSFFKEKIVYSKLKEYSDLINDYRQRIMKYKEDIKRLVDEAEKSKEIWKRIIEDYNSRFVSNRFDVIIENIKDAVLDINPPVFKKIIKGTNTEISAEIFKRFSSGEKRAVRILNLLFEVELRRNKEFTLVLDDVADSFDYKNKYAIIECLRDFAKSTNIQLIILTHNFDFYRSARIALAEDLKSKLIACSNDGDVRLYDAKQEYYENFNYYSKWKNQEREKDVIAILPFLRNIIQLQNNSKDENYKLLTKFLHYDLELESRSISELNQIFDDYKIKHDSFSFNYLEKLDEVVESIISNGSEETDLENKILLGMYLRIFSDKYLYNKYVNFNGTDPSFSDNRNFSSKLFNAIKGSISDSERIIIQTAQTIAPSFIHVNSFMFEPLIDVGTAKLIESARDIRSLFFND